MSESWKIVCIIEKPILKIPMKKWILVGCLLAATTATEADTRLISRLDVLDRVVLVYMLEFII